MHGNWTLQYVSPNRPNSRLNLKRVRMRHSRFLAVAVHDAERHPDQRDDAVIYEFPVDSETTLQNYDIYSPMKS